VQEGAQIQVTSHGRVIARIEPERDPAEDACRWLEEQHGSVILGDVVASIADVEWVGDADHL
jgi:antitoxin (DNA-binding transcriptional repressor) of toxin-antitoxin stability system